MKRRKNVVLVGGGVGSTTFTKAFLDLPVNLATIVSSFDDGGSTGAIRRDYGGIALGDFRQCVFASAGLRDDLMRTLNHRFGRGSLFGVNVGNLVIRAFLDQHDSEQKGVRELHKALGIKNLVLPVSYDFAKLCAVLSDKKILTDQQQISDHLSFAEAPIKELRLSNPARLNSDARQAMLAADYLIFAPGHFFTSVLPHLYVRGFPQAWKKSKAKKIWFVNLLAHKGQDGFYTLKDYLAWFQKKLGAMPFDAVVINKSISKKILNSVRDRFDAVKVTNNDIEYLKNKKISVVEADIVSPELRPQQANDTIMRAPLRHDAKKLSIFFKNFFNAAKKNRSR